jgi:sortase A
VAGVGGPVLAVVRIPRFGAAWREPVQRGTGTAVLRQGLGLYVGSAAPGTVGNLALAGHRTTWGAPFTHLDRLRRGDLITIWTPRGRFDYRVIAAGVTSPGDTSVIRPGAAQGRAMLTMTTCHPEFSARERLYVHAVLQRSMHAVPQRSMKA